jgi:hypothetical protein
MNYTIYSGRLLHITSIGVINFFYIIFSYRYFLLLAFKFCQGNDPFIRYTNTFPNPSKSSLLPCYMPKCVFKEAYRAVPVRFLLSL